MPRKAKPLKRNSNKTESSATERSVSQEQPSSSSQKVRLQKFLADAGITSRRKAETLITAGRVRVNGAVAQTLGVRVDPAKDRIELDGLRVKLEPKKHLFLFHKPQHVVSTLSDPQGRKCLKDYLLRAPVRLFPIGRLDYDVTGLILLTNDGAFMERILHPRYSVPRVYRAVVQGKVDAETLKHLCRGVTLEDGTGRAKTAVRIPLSSIEKCLKKNARRRPDEDYVELTVEEGRNHFIKRLLAACGHPVIQLCRVKFGPYTLGNLAPGELRETDFNTFSAAHGDIPPD